MSISDRNISVANVGNTHFVPLVCISNANGDLITPITRTPSFSRVSANGSIAAGSRSVTIYNSATNTGTVLGTSLFAGETITFAAENQDVLGIITYDSTNTEFVIVKTT